MTNLPLISNSTICLCCLSSADVAYIGQLWHSLAASVAADLIIDLHHYVLFYMILILSIVFIILFNALHTGLFIAKMKYAPRSNYVATQMFLWVRFRYERFCARVTQFKLFCVNMLELFYYVFFLCFGLFCRIVSLTLFFKFTTPAGIWLYTCVLLPLNVMVTEQCHFFCRALFYSCNIFNIYLDKLNFTFVKLSEDRTMFAQGLTLLIQDHFLLLVYRLFLVRLSRLLSFLYSIHKQCIRVWERLRRQTRTARRISFFSVIITFQRTPERVLTTLKCYLKAKAILFITVNCRSGILTVFRYTFYRLNRMKRKLSSFLLYSTQLRAASFVVFFAHSLSVPYITIPLSSHNFYTVGAPTLYTFSRAYIFRVLLIDTICAPSLKRFYFYVLPPYARYLNTLAYYRKITGSWVLELLWTTAPSIILLFIALPSIFVLYLLDEPAGYIVTIVKVIGHQWYWSYEIADCSVSAFMHSSLQLPINQYSFDSYMLHTPVTSLPSDPFSLTSTLRLLEVDHALSIPGETPVAFIVTSDDVIHSWAVPSLGIKIDAVPGRLNQVLCYATRYGIFYGQCSELCGVHHGFMPICINVVHI